MRIAAVQAAPVFLDSQATTDKAVALIGEAAAGGAELCAFGETFLSGYPFWVSLTDGARFNDARQKEAYAAYVAASVTSDGPELAALADAAAEHGVLVYMGLIERASSGTSVYASLAAIHPDDGIVSVHRKLRPTYEERLVWAPGDGAGLEVHDWHGFKVGGLNCWENWMPLARHSLYAKGETVHVAAWPGSPSLTREITRFIAQEGRVYCMSAGNVMTVDNIPASFPLRDEIADSGPFASGGSMIVAPTGEVLGGPIADDETILYADIDLDLLRGERQNFDPAGHYGRPDVFRMMVNRARQEPLD